MAYMYVWRHWWYHGYTYRKWTWWPEFKYLTKLFVFQMARVRQTGVFNLGMLTSLVEGKLNSNSAEKLNLSGILLEQRGW